MTFTDALGFLVRYLVRTAYAMPANSVRPANQAAPTGAEGDEFATVLITSNDSDFGSLSRSYAPPLPPSWTPTGSLTTARLYCPAVSLSNGDVLFVGGMGNSGPLASAELFQKSTGTIVPVGSMLLPRYTHTATFIPPTSAHPMGLVLVTGGSSTPTGRLFTEAEIYDPITRTFAATGSMAVGRKVATATFIPPTSAHPMGLVLVAGGAITANQTIASAELYDPVAGTFSMTGSMITSRWNFASVYLPPDIAHAQGSVLITGGESEDTGSIFLKLCELYDVATGTFAATGSTSIEHIQHQVKYLPTTGNVLLGTGATGPGDVDMEFSAQLELYNVATGTWSNTANMSTNRTNATMTILGNGDVLIAGGTKQGEGYVFALSTAEIYHAFDGLCTLSASMSTGRTVATAAPLSDGTVIVVGGHDESSALASAEVFTLPDQTVVTENLENRYTFQASIQFFRHATPANDSLGLSPFGMGAFDKATRLVNRLSQSDMLDLMGTMNLGIEASSPARNLAGLVDGARWEDRGSVDVTFTIMNSETLLMNLIERVTAELELAQPGQPYPDTKTITAEVTT